MPDGYLPKSLTPSDVGTDEEEPTVKIVSAPVDPRTRALEIALQRADPNDHPEKIIHDANQFLAFLQGRD